MTQHSSLTLERWSQFTIDQQILMIANEMQRGTRLLADAEATSRSLCYERVLRLVDLTVQVRPRRALLKELLRWRDLAAELYLDAAPRPDAHRDALVALLRLRPEASRQIPYLER
jgi:hypothetical protein